MSEEEELHDNIMQEFNRGTLVLSVLLSTREKVYGYSLVTILQEKGIETEQNTLYPLLRRLEKQELLTSTWDTSESRPRKYYQISPEGRKFAEVIKKEWTRINSVVTKLIMEDENENC